MRAARIAALVLAVGLLAGGARGEPRDFAARIAFRLPGLPERTVARGTGVASLATQVPLTRVALTGAIGGSTVVPLTDPLVENAGVVALHLAASLPGGELAIDPFAPPFSEPALGSGALPLAGELRFCLLLPDCSLGFGVPLSAGPGTRGLGVGGVLTVGAGGAIRLSLQGAPFTLGSVSAWGETPDGASLGLLSSGSLHGPLSFTSTAALTLSGVGGRIGLVSPLRIVSSTAPAEGVLPGFARLEIELLPEPSGGSLLPFGTAALALLQRARRLRARRAALRGLACGA